MSMTATVPRAPNSTAASKVTGMNAGSELSGFPPTLVGQLKAEVQIWNQSINAAPSSASAKQT